MIRYCISFLILLPMFALGQYTKCKGGAHLRPLVKSSGASNMRSDTVDILHYNMDLTLTDFVGKNLSGSCTITFTPKQNGVHLLNLDLLGLSVSNITQNGTNLNFTYNDTLLAVTLDRVYNTGDTSAITVEYQGQPTVDPSGFGGFIIQNGFAYNLGVGIETIPHNLGKSWFPCFDNFVERATFSFDIKTANGNKAMCGGMLVAESSLPGGLISRRWELTDAIPTYLASVTVSEYETVRYAHEGLEGPIPIELNALSGDTSALKSSFVNLGAAIDAFEAAFGPYQWQKVGYSLVPFNGGAMEHATNITYPQAQGTSGTGAETLMAHELAHSWWGNLATCHTAEEMWINEGMASYCESLFLEHVYGRQAYEENIASNHAYVIRYPHHLEEDFWALDSIPQRFTYGSHVYQKGADIAHTLRGYLGDSLFFSGLTELLARNRFDDLSSEEMMTQLTDITGVDLTDFFQDWVMQPGFPQFETQGFTAAPLPSGYEVVVQVTQKLKGASRYYRNVPLPITFMDSAWNKHTERVLFSGDSMSFTLELPIKPVYATVDFDNLLSDAITDKKLTVKNNGLYNLGDVPLSLAVENTQDSAFVRVEHMWVAPNNHVNASEPVQLSSSRYIRVDGVIPEHFDARLIWPFDVRSTGPNRFLDLDLDLEEMDTLRVFYRQVGGAFWEEYPYYRKTRIGGPFEFGTVRIDSVLPGDYCMGVFSNSGTSIQNDEDRSTSVQVYPNPSSGSFTLTLSPADENREFALFNSNGVAILRTAIAKGTSEHRFQENLPTGVYFYTVLGTTETHSGKLLIVD